MNDTATSVVIFVSMTTIHSILLLLFSNLLHAGICKGGQHLLDSSCIKPTLHLQNITHCSDCNVLQYYTNSDYNLTTEDVSTVND